MAHRESALHALPSSSSSTPVKNPQSHVWPCRNKWLVKNELECFFYRQMNRFKQQVLVEEFEAERCCMTSTIRIDVNDLEFFDKERELRRVRSESRQKTLDEYEIENADDFVLSVEAEQWRQVVDPYTGKEREALIDCLYKFVELFSVLDLLCSVLFDPATTTNGGFDVFRYCGNDLSKFVNMNVQDVVVAFEAYAASQIGKKETKKWGTPDFWFVDETAYVELGGRVLKDVELLAEHESYRREDDGGGESNYSINDLKRRYANDVLILDGGGGDGGDGKINDADSMYVKRMDVLRKRLLLRFQRDFEKFEMELNFFYSVVLSTKKEKSDNGVTIPTLDARPCHGGKLCTCLRSSCITITRFPTTNRWVTCTIRAT